MVFSVSMTEPLRLREVERKVLDGIKPSALVLPTHRPTGQLKMYHEIGLEAEAVGRQVAIAYPTKASKIIGVVDPKPRPELKLRVEELEAAIGSLTIVPALKYLLEEPRVDQDFPVCAERNLETPAVAYLLGGLLGYRSCCIDYYVDTRYFGMPEHNLTDAYFSKEAKMTFSEDVHVLCESCTIDFIDQ